MPTSSPWRTPLSSRTCGLSAGRREMAEPAGRGQEIPLRVLGVDPDLDRVAADRELVLAAGQGLAGRDLELPFDQVLAGDHLGHRVLDLEPGVHLHEVEALVLAVAGDDELDRAGVLVADRARRRDRGLAHRARGRLGQPRRRRLLDDLLMPALDRAVALEQVHEVAVAVAEHLDLDVARPAQVFFHEHAVVAEGAALRAWRPRGPPRSRSGRSTTLMPLPPPPADALIRTG